MVRKVTVKVAPLYHPHLLHMCLENSLFHLLTKSWVLTTSAPQGQGCEKLKSSFQEAFLRRGKRVVAIQNYILFVTEAELPIWVLDIGSGSN